MAQTGNLEVLVIAANNLKDVETFGRMDPYTVLELSGQKFKTKSRTDAGKNPTWNERFTFINVSPQYSTELTVKVMDKNVMMSDTEIGSGRLALSNIYQVGTQEVRLQLTTSKHKSAGELQMLLTWKPLMAGARPAAQPAVVVLQQPQPVMVAPPPAAYGAPPPPGYGAPPPPAYGAPPPGYGAPPPPAYGTHPGYAAPPPGYPAQPVGYREAPAQHPQQPTSSLYPQLYQPPSV